MTQIIEMKICKTLVQAALYSGYSVSVFRVNKHVIRRSLNLDDILNVMFSNEMEVLTFCDGSEEIIGHVMLTYGNGVGVMSDYTDNYMIASLVNNVMSQYSHVI